MGQSHPSQEALHGNYGVGYEMKIDYEDKCEGRCKLISG